MFLSSLPPSIAAAVRTALARSTPELPSPVSRFDTTTSGRRHIVITAPQVVPQPTAFSVIISSPLLMLTYVVIAFCVAYIAQSRLRCFPPRIAKQERRQRNKWRFLRAREPELLPLTTEPDTVRAVSPPLPPQYPPLPLVDVSVETPPSAHLSSSDREIVSLTSRSTDSHSSLLSLPRSLNPRMLSSPFMTPQLPESQEIVELQEHLSWRTDSDESLSLSAGGDYVMDDKSLRITPSLTARTTSRGEISSLDDERRAWFVSSSCEHSDDDYWIVEKMPLINAHVNESRGHSCEKDASDETVAVGDISHEKETPTYDERNADTEVDPFDDRFRVPSPVEELYEVSANTQVTPDTTSDSDVSLLKLANGDHVLASEPMDCDPSPVVDILSLSAASLPSPKEESFPELPVVMPPESEAPALVVSIPKLVYEPPTPAPDSSFTQTSPRHRTYSDDSGGSLSATPVSQTVSPVSQTPTPPSSPPLISVSRVSSIGRSAGKSRPAWSQRALDAPPLGIATASSSTFVLARGSEGVVSDDSACANQPDGWAIEDGGGQECEATQKEDENVDVDAKDEDGLQDDRGLGCTDNSVHREDSDNALAVHELSSPEPSMTFPTTADDESDVLDEPIAHAGHCADDVRSPEPDTSPLTLAEDVQIPVEKKDDQSDLHDDRGGARSLDSDDPWSPPILAEVETPVPPEEVVERYDLASSSDPGELSSPHHDTPPSPHNATLPSPHDAAFSSPHDDTPAVPTIILMDSTPIVAPSPDSPVVEDLPPSPDKVAPFPSAVPDGLNDEESSSVHDESFGLSQKENSNLSIDKPPRITSRGESDDIGLLAPQPSKPEVFVRQRRLTLPGSFFPGEEFDDPPLAPLPDHPIPKANSKPDISVAEGEVEHDDPALPDTGAEAPDHLRQHSQRKRSPIDVALAMQLRPGLGDGAESAWLVRFLMAFFGWLGVLTAGRRN